MSKRTFEVSAAGLHILAMGFMLCDHLWGTVVPGSDWLTCVGRLAFPIFAFLIAEGYARTRDIRRYVLRLFVFALISEIPFNLMMGGRLLYPVHQNVLWTFLIGLGMIHWNEKGKTLPLWRRGIRLGASVILGALAGTLTFSDYLGAGVLTVLTFYVFRHRTWWCLLGQIAALYCINAEMIGGLGYEMELFGQVFWLTRQSLALLALIPIWLYRGRKGMSSPAFRWFCYGFYPAHMLLLALIGML